MQAPRQHNIRHERRVQSEGGREEACNRVFAIVRYADKRSGTLAVSNLDGSYPLQQSALSGAGACEPRLDGTDRAAPAPVHRVELAGRPLRVEFRAPSLRPKNERSRGDGWRGGRGGAWEDDLGFDDADVCYDPNTVLFGP